MSGGLFTIGHSNHEWPDFLALLRRHGIEVLADVRSRPYSRFRPHFNEKAMRAALGEAGIEYMFLGRELGARREEPEAYRDGRASYELIARLPVFQQGLARVREEAARRRVALMCAEKDPLDCHRLVLVCRHLRGETISHILADGSVESQGEVEKRMVEIAGGLFGEEASVERAYEVMGERMGFRKDR